VAETVENEQQPETGSSGTTNSQWWCATVATVCALLAIGAAVADKALGQWVFSLISIWFLSPWAEEWFRAEPRSQVSTQRRL